MKLGILGHFGVGLTMLNGQTVKSQNLVSGVEKYTDAQVVRIDSHGWIKKPFALLKNIKNAFRECDAVIMLPAHNGVRVFSPLLVHYKKKYKKKIFYDVIGGWLPEFLKDKKSLAKTLKRFDGVWVETTTMKNKLTAMGFENTAVVPNFKELTPLSREELVYPSEAPYRLCTFSRVMKEKGIETAIDAVREVNRELGYEAYHLDIYGQIDSSQQEWFDSLSEKMTNGIEYKGCASPDKSVEILKDYFALLFPTHFYTEGIPGTVIDAYAAGIGVISSRWESFSDVIEEGVTGTGYAFDDSEELKKKLIEFAREPEKATAIKENCIARAEDFSTANAVKKIMDLIKK